MSIQDNLQKQMHCIPWAVLFVTVKYIVREIISTFIIYMVLQTSHTQEDVAYLSSSQ